MVTHSEFVNGVPQQVTRPSSVAGTGFFIFVKDPRLGPDRGISYLVTNKHLIREPNAAGVLGEGPYFKSTLMRVNVKHPAPDGTQYAIVVLSVLDDSGSLLWLTDPDESVDLALIPLGMDQNVADFKYIPTNLFATKDLLKREHIDENDEILFAGLFAWSPGAKKNYPIVRHGKLSRLFEEPVPLDRTHPEKTVEVHLADVMSFGGNSGSPVFLRVGGFRETRMMGGYAYYLLGVMKGFFPEGMDFTINLAELKGVSAQNSGIAAVIPSDKILQILNNPRAKALNELVVARKYEEDGLLEEARNSYKEAISILEKAAPEHGDLATSLDAYAGFLRKHTKLVQDAEKAEARAKAIRSNV